MRTFFDTSFFIKRFVKEVGSEQADDIMEKVSELGLSIICFPEIISALNRKLRSNLIAEKTYLDLKNRILEGIEDADVVNLTPDILGKTTKLLEENSLRSLDAIHIACAIEWQAELFVSSDKRQVNAANKSGLKVRFIEGKQKDK